MASDPQNAASSASGVSGPAPKAYPFPSSVMPSQDEISPARKLVTVRCVESVTPFNGNHNILTLDGWTVAAKKGDGIFKKGEYVVYFEVDSFLPITSNAAPLFQKALGQTSVFQDQKGYRVGTRDIVNNTTPIKSVISQGLVFKLGLFPWINSDFLRRRAALKPTDDFTDIMRNVDYSADLGVIKWESQADPETGNWTIPSFIKRTNTERVQNCPNLFIKPKYRTFVYQESVKLDGRSMTCYFVHRGSHVYPTLHTLGPNYEENAILPNGRFGVCSKQCELSNNVPNPYWDTALELRLNEIMAKTGMSIAIQGELVGWSIEGNPYNYPENKRDFFVYTVINIETRERWHPKDVKDFADVWGLKHVKIIGYTTLPAIAKSHKELVDRADKGEGEGLVFKCCDDNRWFKVLSSKYIITKGDEARALAEEKARSGKNNNGAPPAPYGQHLKSAEAMAPARPQVGGSQLASQLGTTATTKTTQQASTTAFVAVPRSLEENRLSFEEAAGLVPKPNLNKMSLAFLLAPTSPTQESQVDKMSSVPFNDSASTEEAAAVENSEVSPLTPKPLIILFTNADISSHKQVTIPVQSSDNSPHSTTHTEAQPITAVANTQAQPITAAAEIEAQPITAAADTNTESAAHEPGYHNMSKADFDHFTQTCFAAENAGAHGWLEGWSSGYLQTHGKPLEFDTAGNIVNASTPAQVATPTENVVNTTTPAQVPTPVEHQTRAPAPTITRRWTNSRLRYNSLPIVPVTAAPKDTVPTVPENTRWVNTTIDLTDGAPTVHKESVTLTTRDNNGRLVKTKLTIKSGTLPTRFSRRVANASTRANSVVPRVQTEASRVSPTVARPTSIPARPTPSSQRVPLVTLRVLGGTPRVSPGVARPTSVVTPPTLGTSRPTSSSQGLTSVPAGPTSIPQGLAPVMAGPTLVPQRISTSTVTVAGGAGAASAASAAIGTGARAATIVPASAATNATTANADPRHLPIGGGEQTMSGRYRGFAQWLGIVGGGGVDDVKQE